MNTSNNNRSDESSNSDNKIDDDNDKNNEIKESVKSISKSDQKVIYTYASRLLTSIIKQDHNHSSSPQSSSINTFNEINADDKGNSYLSDDSQLINNRNSTEIQNDDYIHMTFYGFQLLLVEMLAIGNYKDGYQLAKLLFDHRNTTVNTKVQASKIFDYVQRSETTITASETDDMTVFDSNNNTSTNGNKYDINHNGNSDRSINSQNFLSDVSEERTAKYLRILQSSSVGLGVFKGRLSLC